MKNKIILYALEDRCKQLKSEENSLAAIADILTNESKKTISVMSVSRYFAREQSAMQQAICANSQLQTKKAETHLNSIEQLSHVNAETLEILKTAKVSGDLKTALQAIARVESQLELQARLLGDIDDSPKVVAIREIYINEQERRD